MEIAAHSDAGDAMRAAALLARDGSLSETVIARLTEIASSAGAVEALRAAELLSNQSPLAHSALGHLVEVMAESEDHEVFGETHFARREAAELVASQPALPPATTDRLFEIAEDEAVSWNVRANALAAVANASIVTEELVTRTVGRLGDVDNDVRKAAAKSLVEIARDEIWRSTVEQVLLKAIADPRFDVQDKFENRAGWDYAYDALWQLAQAPPNMAAP